MCAHYSREVEEKVKKLVEKGMVAAAILWVRVLPDSTPRVWHFH